MASLLLRSVRSVASRPCIRLLNSRTKPVALSRAFASDPKTSIATDEEQATGLERAEYDALVAGYEDPFRLKMANGPAGTRDSPTVVPSGYDERIVGCVCEEDATMIRWMLLKAGPAQRCDCGNFFELKDASPIDVKI